MFSLINLMIFFPDFNTPFTPPGSAPVATAVSEEFISMLMPMGFERHAAEKALRKTVSHKKKINLLKSESVYNSTFIYNSLANVYQIINK